MFSRGDVKPNRNKQEIQSDLLSQNIASIFISMLNFGQCVPSRLEIIKSNLLNLMTPVAQTVFFWTVICLQKK